MEACNTEKGLLTEIMDNSAFIRCLRFVKHHIKQVRVGGIRVFLRKLSTLIGYYKVVPAVFLFVPLLPVVVFIRIIRPFLLVRFGVIENQRLGHYAANPELYLCERDAGLQPGKAFDIFYKINPVFTSNMQLEMMWKRSGCIRIWEIARFLQIVNHSLPGYRKHTVVLPIDRDTHGLYDRFPVHISFTEQEEEEGQKSLHRMGIPEGAKFVCFYSRDPEYLNAVFPEGIWNYQNHRDSSIENFIPAAEELAARGYYTLRMGAVVKTPLKTDNPFVIDYATRFRTEFLDVYLGAKCAFYLGDPCGMNAIPFVFRRPVISTNFIPLEYVFTWNACDISIIKKLWLRKDRRFMTFREIMESGAGRFVQSQQYEALGVDIIENTAEEIVALAIEADERLRGVYETTEEDEKLQRRFWAYFKPNDLNRIFKARIGADFLQKNKNLLQ